MKIWITVVGRSPFAVINSILAAGKNWNFIPEKIYFLRTKHDEIKKNCQICKVWVKNFTVKYSFEKKEPEFHEMEFHEESTNELLRLTDEVLKKVCTDENEIIIDVTPGRKYMSILLFNLGIKYKDSIRGICYNHLFNDEYQNIPLPLIPIPEYELVNFLRKEVK
ncbi:MAG: CRISPR-associated ring nuclease [Candidatus Helarchaeota archaeon]